MVIPREEPGFRAVCDFSQVVILSDLLGLLGILGILGLLGYLGRLRLELVVGTCDRHAIKAAMTAVTPRRS